MDPRWTGSPRPPAPPLGKFSLGEQQKGVSGSSPITRCQGQSAWWGLPRGRKGFAVSSLAPPPLHRPPPPAPHDSSLLTPAWSLGLGLSLSI